MLGEAGTSGLMAQVYDAARGRAGWADVAGTIQRVLGADGAGILFGGGPECSRPGEMRVAVVSGDRRVTLDVVERATRGVALPAPGRPVAQTFEAPPDGAEAGGFVVRCFGDRPDEALVSLVAWRAASATPLRQGAADVLAFLAPHVQRASAIALDRARLGLERDALLSALDRVVLGVVLVDADLQILQRNSRAVSILGEKDGLYEESGQLRAIHPADELLLRGMVTTDSPQPGRSAESTLSVERRQRKRSLALVIQVLRRQEGSPIQGPAAVIFIHDPDAAVQISPDRVAELYALTRAESRVAVRLGSGMCLADTARELGISQQTARSYLKSVFRKTQTARQSELVGLLVGCPARVLD